MCQAEDMGDIVCSTLLVPKNSPLSHVSFIFIYLIVGEPNIDVIHLYLKKAERKTEVTVKETSLRIKQQKDKEQDSVRKKPEKLSYT